jgi:IS4 transposase
LPAPTKLYRCRRQFELIFKWIKQPLRIKTFVGTSENAVQSQEWIVVSVYVLVAIVRKLLQLDPSLHETRQLLSRTMFETPPLHQLLTLDPLSTIPPEFSNQLSLFALLIWRL